MELTVEVGTEPGPKESGKGGGNKPRDNTVGQQQEGGQLERGELETASKELGMM